MKTRMYFAAVGLAALAACSGGNSDTSNAKSDTPAVTAPAGTDWVATVSETADGGMLMGNPDAKVKFMEYGALSCPHCAKFSVESSEGLKAMVAKGTLSYEFRPFLIHPQDVPAFLLARCNGPAPFFAISEQMFAQQESWLSKSGEITQAEQQALQGQPPLAVASFLATKLGLDSFVAQRGVPSAKAKACLADEKALDKLGKISEQAQSQYQITGTPTFIINGQVVRDANSWDKIEPMLKAAGA